MTANEETELVFGTGKIIMFNIQFKLDITTVLWPLKHIVLHTVQRHTVSISANDKSQNVICLRQNHDILLYFWVWDEVMGNGFMPGYLIAKLWI